MQQSPMGSVQVDIDTAGGAAFRSRRCSSLRSPRLDAAEIGAVDPKSHWSGDGTPRLSRDRTRLANASVIMDGNITDNANDAGPDTDGIEANNGLERHLSRLDTRPNRY